MARVTLLIMLSIAAVVALILGKANSAVITKRNTAPLDVGIEMITKAMQGACWYEFLKRPSGTEARTNTFQNCYVNLDFVYIQKRFESMGAVGDAAIPSLSNQLIVWAKKFLPPNYNACELFAKNPNKAAKDDFSSSLKEPLSNYPFRGFAHCVLAKLKEERGIKAISALETRWHSKKGFLEFINERENDNRAQHSSKPVAVNKELTQRAQRWADQLAKRCGHITHADHIQPNHPDYLYKGKPTGESIAMHSAKIAPRDSAFMAANGWYEEVRDYPWPEYTGHGKDTVFGKIGHFTAQVWAGTHEAGYGMARREGCDKVYVVARYFPAGNVAGQFGKNVLPRES